MTPDNSPQKYVRALIAVFEKLRDALLGETRASDIEAMSRLVGEDADDSIYALDVTAAKNLAPLLDDYLSPVGGAVVVAEGMGEITISSKSGGAPRYRILIDPIDGTRCLMYGKRSAWALAAIAPDKGADTRLNDAFASVMVELPTPRAALADSIWAIKGHGAHGETTDLRTGARVEFIPRPSKATTLLDGFAMISRFFPGGKDLIAAVEEDFMAQVVEQAAKGKATVFEDQYICTGGQMREIAMGHDRFCADIRKAVYAYLEKEEGLTPGHCCRPHDASGFLVATESGAIITDLTGAPFDAPMDTLTDIDWVGYANKRLKDKLEKPFQNSLRKFGLI